MIVLEVKTFRAPTQEARLADLAEALEFTRTNLARPDGAAGGPDGAKPGPVGTGAGSSRARLGVTVPFMTTTR